MQKLTLYAGQHITAQNKRTSSLLTLALLIGLISLLLSACNEQAKTPLEVSRAFWAAVQEKNSDDLKGYIASGSFEGEIQAENILSVSEISFGKIVIDENQAQVETEVTIESDKPTMIPINTMLIKEEDQWKVDYQATVDAVTMPGEMTLFLRELKTLGEKLSEEFDHSMKELDQAMPEIEKEISEMGNQIKERVPELKQRFDEMAEQIRKSLEESLQELPPVEDKQADPQETPTDEQTYSI